MKAHDGDCRNPGGMERSSDRHVSGHATGPTRRSFLGSTGLSMLVPAACGLLCGTRSSFVTGIFGARPAAAETPRPLAPVRPPAFPALSEADRREWVIFRRRFIASDGRVIDTGNNCVSHTEGQGWGMLFAVTFNDRATFDRIYDWTQQNLRRGEDSLHSWRYDPSLPNPVADPNNATDGDLFIAWALWKAAYRWQNPAYADQARAIGRDILDLLVVKAGERMVLLPGVCGFEHTDHVAVNLSYYCFPALRDLAQAVPSPAWETVQQTGLALIDEGRFGRYMLPPDWLSVSRSDGSLQPASGWPPRFAFDAIRIPLYLHWARAGSAPSRAAFTNYWAETSPQTPAWVDLVDGMSAPYASPPGMVAVAKVATTATKNSSDAIIPSIHSSPDYYSSALILLSRLAAYETET